MPQIAEPLRPVRVLTKPKKFPPLRDFSCGRKGNRWEKLVNDWVRMTYLGQYGEAQTVVVLEDARGCPIGVANFKPKPPPGSDTLVGRFGKFVTNVQYIHMFAIDRLYHGQCLQDGSRLGDVLMAGTLKQIERACDDRMPYVWAHVSPENAPARALFTRHGFKELPYAGEGEIAYMCSPYATASLDKASVRIAHLIARLRRPSRSAPPLPSRGG